MSFRESTTEFDEIIRRIQNFSQPDQFAYMNKLIDNKMDYTQRTDCVAIAIAIIYPEFATQIYRAFIKEEQTGLTHDEVLAVMPGFGYGTLCDFSGLVNRKGIIYDGNIPHSPIGSTSSQSFFDGSPVGDGVFSQCSQDSIGSCVFSTISSQGSLSGGSGLPPLQPLQPESHRDVQEDEGTIRGLYNEFTKYTTANTTRMFILNLMNAIPRAGQTHIHIGHATIGIIRTDELNRCKDICFFDPQSNSREMTDQRGLPSRFYCSMNYSTLAFEELLKTLFHRMTLSSFQVLIGPHESNKFPFNIAQIDTAHTAPERTIPQQVLTRAKSMSGKGKGGREGSSRTIRSKPYNRGGGLSFYQKKKTKKIKKKLSKRRPTRRTRRTSSTPH